MAVDLLYVVQPYMRSAGRLVPGMAQCSTSGVDAEEMGEGMAPFAAGVVVFSIECDQENDLWGEPELVARHGDVPAGVPTIRPA